MNSCCESEEIAEPERGLSREDENAVDDLREDENAVDDLREDENSVDDLRGDENAADAGDLNVVETWCRRVRAEERTA